MSRFIEMVTPTPMTEGIYFVQFRRSNLRTCKPINRLLYNSSKEAYDKNEQFKFTTLCVSIGVDTTTIDRLSATSIQEAEAVLNHHFQKEEYQNVKEITADFGNVSVQGISKPPIPILGFQLNIVDGPAIFIWTKQQQSGKRKFDMDKENKIYLCAVGANDGSAIGANDGSAIGANEGVSVGANDSGAVGANNGGAVGANDGSAVGDNDGILFRI
jgi:hypothetical protein